MTDKQPEALRLAAKMDLMLGWDCCNEAADELRRLYVVNAVLIKTLDQLANGTHLDDIPNHSDDSLLDIASSLEHGSWAQKKLLKHFDRVDTAIAKATGEQQ